MYIYVYTYIYIHIYTHTYTNIYRLFDMVRGKHYFHLLANTYTSTYKKLRGEETRNDTMQFVIQKVSNFFDPYINESWEIKNDVLLRYVYIFIYIYVYIHTSLYIYELIFIK
jgi:predicted P-loop ATPase/GTPase